MSFESVKAIIDGHTYQSLIGLQEDAWLEVKGSLAYDLATPNGRYELAKDVSAFANGTGGIIIIGLQTSIRAETHTEEITGFDLRPRAAFDEAPYGSLIREYIYPAIEGLNAYWVPVNAEMTQGLGIIEVPPQDPNRQYFLIKNAVDGGAPIRQFVFGIVRRSESSNDPFTISDLYQHIRKGKSPLAETLTRIEDKLDTVLTQGRTTSTPDPEEIYAVRAARMLDE